MEDSKAGCAARPWSSMAAFIRASPFPRCSRRWGTASDWARKDLRELSSGADNGDQVVTDLAESDLRVINAHTLSQQRRKVAQEPGMHDLRR